MASKGIDRFSKARRLTSGFEFRRTLRGGQVRRSGDLLVAVRENGLGTSRIGISIGRKVCNAVLRNRVKRLLREIFRKHAALRQSSWDIVVVIHKYDDRVSFSSLCRDFNSLIAQWI